MCIRDSVDDKIHIWLKLFGSQVMRDGFYNAVIQTKRMLDDVFSISRHRGRRDVDLGIIGVKLLQIFLDDGHGVAAVGTVKGAEQVAVPSAQHGLDGRRAGVNAQKHILCW